MEPLNTAFARAGDDDLGTARQLGTGVGRADTGPDFAAAPPVALGFDLDGHGLDLVGWRVVACLWAGFGVWVAQFDGCRVVCRGAVAVVAWAAGRLDEFFGWWQGHPDTGGHRRGAGLGAACGHAGVVATVGLCMGFWVCRFGRRGAPGFGDVDGRGRSSGRTKGDRLGRVGAGAVCGDTIAHRQCVGRFA